MNPDGTQNHEPQSAEPEMLSLSHFDHLTGVSFAVELDGVTHNLTLRQVQELPGSPRKGGGFRLEFLGASSPTLPQAIYPFTVDGTLREIFIVPLGPQPDGRMQYEAVFF